MALSLFGVTYSTVRAHHFPQLSNFSVNSHPTLTTVGEMVDASAAELAGRLRSKGINPATISAASATYPEAYAWCADATRMGAAARAYRAMSGQDPEVARALEARLEALWRQLDEYGYLALGDAPAPSEEVNGPRTHISSLSLDTGDELDASDVVPTFRRSDAL